MTIAKIPGLRPPIAAPRTSHATTTTGKTFQVARDAPVAPKGRAAPVTALERLQAGELDAKGYAEARIEEALSHVNGISATERALLRDELRARLESPDELGWLLERAIK
jgi:hypothetical protein